MKKRELEKMGYPFGFITDLALRACGIAAKAGIPRQELRKKLKALIDEPRAFLADPVFAQVATQLLERPTLQNRYEFQSGLAYAVWGAEDIDPAAHEQMRNACRLPVSVAAALMPDAHVGYGLPIGGVLATDNAVIPYAVGVDIACRVKVTVFDLPPERLTEAPQRFANILERETLFGVGKGWWRDRRPTHDVLDADWSFSPITQQVKDLAWEQLGTSGSGNHFVEFGEIEFGPNGLGVPPSRYLAVVSHSGSRGPGSRVADYYSHLARDLHPGLPKELGHLAWLPMDGVGAEYWAAMELMGRYASANHEIIHRKIIRAVGAPVVYQVENHHNFAWREQHGDREVIVHRKGATPAGQGAIGYIPGSMSAPGFLVEGLGDPRSLNSASHGAGRRMSRTKARQTTRWNQLKAYLEQRGVQLLSAGLDESPHAYKDIEEVMRAQASLVKPLARFMPRLVKMAPEGERPED